MKENYIDVGKTNLWQFFSTRISSILGGNQNSCHAADDGKGAGGGKLLTQLLFLCNWRLIDMQYLALHYYISL